MLNTLFLRLRSDEMGASGTFFLKCCQIRERESKCEFSLSPCHKPSPRQELLHSAQSFCGDLNFHTPPYVCTHNKAQQSTNRILSPQKALAHKSIYLPLRFRCVINISGFVFVLVIQHGVRNDIQNISVTNFSFSFASDLI